MERDYREMLEFHKNFKIDYIGTIFINIVLIAKFIFFVYIFNSFLKYIDKINDQSVTIICILLFIYCSSKFLFYRMDDMKIKYFKKKDGIKVFQNK